MDFSMPGPLPDFAREVLAEVDRRVKRHLDADARKTEAAHSRFDELTAAVRGLERRSGSDALKTIETRLDAHKASNEGFWADLRSLDARLSALEKPKPAPRARKPATTAAKPAAAEHNAPRKIAAKPKAPTEKAA